MTAAEFNVVLESIGWSRNELARRLGLGTDRAVRRWSSGQNAVPPAISAWLLEVARVLENLRPPEDWQDAERPGGYLASITPDE